MVGTQSNTQLRQVGFYLLHSSRDYCEVRQRCGQKPGQQALSVLLQIWRRADTSTVVSRKAAHHLRGAGCIVGEVRGSGHCTTVVTLALWAGVWRILKICFVESSFLFRGALGTAFGPQRVAVFLQDSVPHGPIIMDNQLRALSQLLHQTLHRLQGAASLPASAGTGPTMQRPACPDCF